MNDAKFLQIHTLTGYSAALLNRDDTGLAKRLPFGGAMRTRVSSQCLKRHWRIADDPNGLDRIDGSEAAYRSRELVTHLVIDPLRERFDGTVIKAIEPEIQMAVYGDKGTAKASRQTLLFGAPEIAWLKAEAERLAQSSDPAEAVKEWRKAFKANIKAMRDAATLPGGLASALFGRMVTSDTAANITAPIYVAHAFTTHEEEAESDYFTAVDDLSGDEPGADTIQETELSSGIFYGYVVIDLAGLRANLGGDAALAGQVVRSLIYLIAEVSPGAKLGSTAPFGRAGVMLIEAGDRQPRSLAEAFRDPTAPSLPAAAAALAAQLDAFDRAYETGETRRALSLVNQPLPGADPATLRELADWAGAIAGAAS